MVDFALENTSVRFHKHDVTGFSDDADALLMPTVDIAAAKRGADGKQVVVSTGDKGGPVTLKLNPNSPSVKFFASAVVAQQRGAGIRWEAIVKYNDLGISVLLDNGSITSAPLAQTLGKGEAANYEITFEFEEITANYLASSI
jgi:hypothetical protein